MSIARTGRAEVIVDAPPEAAWQVVSDVTRTGEWSSECRQVRWLGGAPAAGVGVRFRGRNRNGWLRWTRTCAFICVDAPRELVWHTRPTPLYPDSTEWRITLEPAGAGTRIVETYAVTTLPGWMDRFLTRATPGHQDRTTALTEDLQRLAAIVAGTREQSRPRG